MALVNMRTKTRAHTPEPGKMAAQVAPVRKSPRSAMLIKANTLSNFSQVCSWRRIINGTTPVVTKGASWTGKEYILLNVSVYFTCAHHFCGLVCSRQMGARLPLEYG